MADDSQRAKARATFGSSFFENSKSVAPPKNYATAQQKTANSRPIPTYKVGGAVKKAEGGQPRNRPMPYERPSRPLTPEEMKRVKATAMTTPPAQPKVPDRMYQGRSERGDDAVKPAKKAAGGLPNVRKAAIMQRAAADAGSPVTGMAAPALKMAGGGLSEFGKAFRDARKSGVDEFTFKGKKYTTEMAKPPPKAEAPAIKYHEPSELTKRAYSAPASAPAAAPPRNQTPADMYRQMMKDAAPAPNNAPKTLKESMKRVADAEAARNARRDAESDAAAKRRGRDIQHLFMGKAYYDLHPEERPDYLKRGEEANKGFKKGGKVQTSSDTARKLAKEMGGMKKGGACAPMKPQQKNLGGVMESLSPLAKFAKSDLGRVIGTGLIGAAMGRGNPLRAGAIGAVGSMLMGRKKRPMAPVNTGINPAANQAATPVPGQDGVNKYLLNNAVAPEDTKFVVAKKGGAVGKYAVGGAGKTRKGQAPIKRAQGGAAKVRKGMMTQSGQITPGVKPHKGIGGF